jgi:hypothetical protein
MHCFPLVLPPQSPNEDTCIPLGAAAKFTIIFRNETSGLTANMRIIKPDGTNLSTWTHNSTASYTGSVYGYTRTMPSVAGTYVFESVYNGDTCLQDLSGGMRYSYYFHTNDQWSGKYTCISKSLQ